MTATETRPESSEPRPVPPPGTPDEQRSALVRLALILAAAVLAAAVTGVTKTVAVVAAIILMIMLHELGHFMTAKWGGMKVTEYFLGFGPRLWSVRKGETEYGIKAIPAGGYVRIIGMNNLEEVPPEDEPRTYRQKSYPRRMAVAVAGSAMHMLIALVLLFVLFAFVGRPDGNHPQLKVGELVLFKQGKSPAQEAGFQLGDKIVTVDGQKFSRWEDLPPYIQDRAGQPIQFAIERDGKPLMLTATPVDRSTISVKGSVDLTDPDSHTGFIGIGPAFPVQRTSVIGGVGRAFTELGSETKQTVIGLAHIATFQGLHSFTSQFTGEPSSSSTSSGSGSGSGVRFQSPIGIVRLAGQAADTGLREVLVLLVAINIFVAIFNMIPLPPFDGGHVAVATYERIRSRKGRRYHADVAKLMPVAYAVVLLLVFISLSSVYLDIFKPANNPFQ